MWGVRKREGVLTVTTTETRRNYLHLNMTLLWGPEGACLVAEVLWTVEDDCVMRREGNWAHCVDQSGCGKAGSG